MTSAPLMVSNSFVCQREYHYCHGFYLLSLLAIFLRVWWLALSPPFNYPEKNRC